MGVVTLIAAGLLSPSLVVWMSPTIAGLILAIPLSWASGQLWIGVALRSAGMLTTPEESAVPPIIVRANALAGRARQSRPRRRGRARAIVPDPPVREAHELFLPEAGRGRRGDVDVDEAVATAKLNDARTLDEACAWLKTKERLAVLNDRALISMLARLPIAAEPPPCGRRAGGDAPSSAAR